MSLIETEIEREARIRSGRGYTSQADEYDHEYGSNGPYTARGVTNDNAPYFEGRDIAAAALAAAMMLGPLTAYAVGLGG